MRSSNASRRSLGEMGVGAHEILLHTISKGGSVVSMLKIP